MCRAGGRSAPPVGVGPLGGRVFCAEGCELPFEFLHALRESGQKVAGPPRDEGEGLEAINRQHID
jgi:hypothetical protein